MEWLVQQDVSELEHWLLVAKADKLKKKIESLDLLSLVVAPVSKKHGQLIDRERSRMVKQYKHVLGLDEVQREADVSETERSLGECFGGGN